MKVRIEMVPHGWEPPLEEKFAVVEIARSGTVFFQGTKQIDGSGVFGSNNAAPDIANAIDDATEWAKANGALVVYVVRPEGIAR